MLEAFKIGMMAGKKTNWKRGFYIKQDIWRSRGSETGMRFKVLFSFPKKLICSNKKTLWEDNDVIQNYHCGNIFITL